MNFKELFAEDFNRPNTAYYIFDTKGTGVYGDVDFIKYEWSPSFYSLPKDGDLFLYRRPSGSSETGEFYFFGACRIKQITKIGKDRVSAALDKTYPFTYYVRQKDLEDYEWKWKPRGRTWWNFFHQYGMNKISREDFIAILNRSEDNNALIEIDIFEEVKAIQSIQRRDFYAPDITLEVKIRSRQKAFADKVKANYKFACCVCGLANRDFLVGAHIIAWAQRKETRLDPRNGLCLCAFHDKAFEHGYISLTNEYRLLVREDVSRDNILNQLLSPLRGMRIKLPKIDKPCLEYIEWHRKTKYERSTAA
jgi:putative restriction endonuclease